MKKLCVMLAGFIVMLGLSVSSYAMTAEIGVVNYAQVLKSPSISASSAKLNETFMPRKKKILALQEDLQNAVNAFQKNEKQMNSVKRKKARAHIANLRERWVSDSKEYQKDLSEATQKVLARINQSIAIVAKSKHLNLVMSRAVIPYADDSFDITNDVINDLK